MKKLIPIFILFAVSYNGFAQSLIEGTNPITDAYAYAVKGTISSTSPGGYSAGVRGQNNGTGGLGIGVWGSQNGSGWGVYGNAVSGIGVHGNSTSGYGIYGVSSTGTGIYGLSTSGPAGIFQISNNANANTVLTAANTGTGITADFTNSNASNSSTVMTVTNAGTGKVATFTNNHSTNSANAVNITAAGSGNGLSVQLSNVSSGGRGIDVLNSGVGPGVFSIAYGNAVWGTTSSFSAAGVVGDNNVGGEAVVGRVTSGDPNKDGIGVGAVVGRNDLLNGYGVRGFVTKAGAIGVFGQGGHSGGINIAARFENINANNTSDVMQVLSNSENNLAVFKKSGSNVARIDYTGKGFFNGGTVSSGADLAEAFEVEGNSLNYEPGDVMIISTNNDRTLAKSDGAYSNLVIGVYATKPGVLLSEENIDNLSGDNIPLGVVGVIPTKVCLEGGEIKRGDFLVSSSIKGVAMKGDLEKIKVGQLIGKALQDYNTEGVGKIKVMVNVR